jgi:glycosyltransferase involved in cell wall biosynthesis
LRTTYPDLRIVAVNDRSTDTTGAIIERLAREDARLTALNVQHLPDGWLGKVHALHVGVEYCRAQGFDVDADVDELFLFTDADIHFAEHSLHQAVAYISAHNLDHLSVLPETLKPVTIKRSEEFVMEVILIGFATLFLYATRAWQVRDPASEAFIGVGAFNLVRRQAFQQTPGFEWLKMEVLDDVGLGKMMKKVRGDSSGGRSDVVNGLGCITLEWYPSLRAMIAGFEKNFFAGFAQYKWSLVVLRVVQIFAFVGLPWIAAFVVWMWSGEVMPALVLACAHVIVPFAIALLTSNRLSAKPWVVSALVFGYVLIAWLLVRSAWKVSRQGGIVWRGTHYTLDVLRLGQRVRL